MFNPIILWIRFFLCKFIIARLVKKFPIFYGTRRFITVFIRARHWTVLGQMNSVHNLAPYFFKTRFHCLLYSHLCPGLRSRPLPLGSPTNFRIHFSVPRVLNNPSIYPTLYDHPNIWGRVKFCSSSYAGLISSILLLLLLSRGLNILVRTLLSHILNLWYFLRVTSFHTHVKHQANCSCT
jgi:hypothetical protein